ncbi:S41 family peptidase [Luteimonas huabeiensis]|uniref:S41 family peptidase n=1 Tax=Luteimonas huabeiensis TaxID=1244513 RepID=UPI000467E86E|nr:S41 family peptidase [Luteimonas huabeiensis]
MRVRLLPFLIAGLLSSAPLLAQEPAAAPVQQDAQPAQAPAPAQDAPAADGPPAESAPPAEGPAAPDERERARQVPAVDDPDGGGRASSRVPLDEIRRYVTVYNAVREAYVDPVDDADLMQAAIRGLLLDLDPHSAYLQGEDAEAFDESTTGAYSGIGVEIVPLPDGSMRVIAPIDDTPAARAGLRSGDVIVAIDGAPLTPASHEGQGPLRGEPGTTVTLTVMREGEAEPLEVPIQRETIRVVSVRSRMLEPGYGYVRVSAFQVETAAEFRSQVEALKAQAGGRLRGLVLDLRSNPGGLLTAAVQIADDLLDAGQIVSTRGRIPISDAVFNATPGDLLDGAPVVVLVDAGSASASEVLAGALRDNGRARVVGSRTFGKGSVQTLLPLDNGDSVKLTTARYYTPSGRSIQARGIDPDVVLKPDNAPARRNGYSEATLPGHLRGDEEGRPGEGAGDVLDGDGPIQAALSELKQPGSVARAAAAAPAPAPTAAERPAEGAVPAAPAEAPANDGAPADSAPTEGRPAEGAPPSAEPPPGDGD